MANTNCRTEDKYVGTNGTCCDRCSAGTYLKTKCDGSKNTECAKCEPGHFIDTKNHLPNCRVCKSCNSNNKQIKTNCTAVQNTVCECVTGFFCANNDCDHCNTLTTCGVGHGVKVQATRTTDIVCAPCENGTYSNISDFHSPCKAHTSCEDYGREVKILGTSTTDAVCGNFKSYCHWMLPAGLWSGLVLTLLVVFVVLLLQRVRRKSYKTVSSSVPVKLVEMVPALPVSPSEMSSHCQETCTINECKLTLFDPDDSPVICDIHHSLDSSIPKLKPSVSFAESSHINGNSGYCTGNFLRSHSEPQEDEWCGTTD